MYVSHYANAMQIVLCVYIIMHLQSINQSIQIYQDSEAQNQDIDAQDQDQDMKLTTKIVNQQTKT